MYLLGKPFVIQTDHRALDRLKENGVWLFNRLIIVSNTDGEAMPIPSPAVLTRHECRCIRGEVCGELTDMYW